MKKTRSAIELCACGAVTVALLAAGTPAVAQTYTFDEGVIRVEIEKPEAFYILSPSNLDYESLPAEESFLPELYETVEEEPF